METGEGLIKIGNLRFHQSYLFYQFLINELIFFKATVSGSNMYLIINKWVIGIQRVFFSTFVFYFILRVYFFGFLFHLTKVNGPKAWQHIWKDFKFICVLSYSLFDRTSRSLLFSGVPYRKEFLSGAARTLKKYINCCQTVNICI